MTAVAVGRLPPGPRGRPLLGNALELQRDILAKLMEGWREHGDVVRFKVPGFAIYLLAHPDHVKHVLQDRHRNYPKIPFVDNKFKRISGEGLLTSAGEFWLRQRRLSQPAFHRQRIEAFATLMTDTTAQLLERWARPAADGAVVDLRVEMMRLSLDVMSQALFSADLSRDADVIGNAVSVEFEHTHKRLNALVDLPLRVPVPSNRRFLRSRSALDAIVYPLITQRRRSEEDHGDFLSMLMAVRDEETGAAMTDLQVRDEIMTFIFAGHETVSTGLTWVWYLLSKHPAVWRRLRAEVDDSLDGRVPTVADLPRLEYTSAVIHEALRLYPPIWLIARTPLQDDEVGGYHVPAGTFVFCPPYVVQRHPGFWDNPEGFDPGRFAPERAAGRHRYAFFPFGGGPRKCIGDYFGLMEMQLVVAMIAQRYRLDLVPGHRVVPQPVVSLRVRDGLPMTLTPVPRRHADSAPDAAADAGTAPARQVEGGL